MATSTLRAAIIVAAIVLGAVVLANAFPGSVNTLPRTDPTTPGPTVSPTGTTNGGPTTPPTATLEGAVLDVQNGSSQDGLAGATAECLRGAGAVVPEANVGDAEDDFAITTLLFRPGDRPLADLLEQRFFPGARVLENNLDNPKPNVQVTVILGEDYEPAEECA